MIQFCREEPSADPRLVEIIYQGKKDWSPRDTRSGIARLIVHSDLSFLVAREKEALALSAWMPEMLAPDPRSEATDQSADLTLFFVDPDRWGTGLADDLLGATFKEMRQDGFLVARLWTPAQSWRARKFYMRHGFLETRNKEIPGGMKLLEFVCDL